MRWIGHACSYCRGVSWGAVNSLLALRMRWVWPACCSCPGVSSGKVSVAYLLCVGWDEVGVACLLWLPGVSCGGCGLLALCRL